MKRRLVVCSVLLVAAACQPPSGKEGGVETGPCVDYQCFGELVCLSNLCVDPGGGTSSGPIESSTAPADGESEPGTSTSSGPETPEGSTGDDGIQVTISPDDPTVATTTQTQFTATVTGTADTAVTWSLVGDLGEVSAGGEYTAPLLPGVVQLQATSVADPTVVATTTITVEDRAGKQDLGFFGTLVNAGNETAGEAILDEDGSIFVAGSHTGAIVLPWHMAVVRVHPDGGIDATFGENGLLRAGPTLEQAYGYSLLRRGADELLVGGSSDGMAFALATTEGQLVPGFGTDGVEYVPSGGDARASTMAAMPPDRFVAGGDEQIFLFEDDGTAVPTFAGDGIAEATIPAAWADYWPYSDAYRVLDLLVQPDGRILVLGLSPPDLSSGAMVVARLTETGQPDPTFGTGGARVYAKDEVASMIPREMLLLDDDRIMVAGAHHGRLFVTRILADGTLDTSFGTDGWTQHVYDRNVAFEYGNIANAIVQLPDGSFVVLCSIGDNLAGVLRMDAEGTVDLSFGDDFADGWGRVDTGFDSIDLDAVDLLFQPPGRLIAVVDTELDVDLSFGIYGFHVY